MSSKILFLLVSFPLYLFAQGYNIKNYSLEEGLAQSQVNDIEQDKFGNIWFATQGGGICRFNGQDFKTYNKEDGLNTNIIFTLDIDRKGNLWLTTEKGISKYDGRNFTHFNLNDKDNNQLPKSIFCDSHGRVLFSFPQGGLGIIQDDTIATFREAQGFTNHHISHFTEDNHGNIVISTFRDGVFFLKQDEFVRFHQINSDYVINNIIYDKVKDNYLFSTKDGLFRLQNDSIVDYTHLVPFQEHFYIRNIALDQQGVLWAATLDGAFRFNGQSVTEFKDFQGLSSGYISDVFVDRENCVWFASFGQGVFQYRGETFMYINEKHGMADQVVMSITKDKTGNLWMGTIENLYQFDGKKIHKISGNDKIPSQHFNALEVDQEGNVWLGSRHYGLYKYNNGSVQHFHHKKDGIISNQMVTAEKDTYGNIWFGTVGGLLKYDGKSFTNIYTSTKDEFDCIWSIHALGKEKLLLGTETGLKFYNNNQVKPYSGDRKLEEGIILSMASLDNKQVYLGVMDEGVVRYNLETKELYTINTETGLSSNLIYSLIFDNSGNLLVGTEKGIDRISFHENGDVLLINNFNKNEGFFGIETNQDAVYKDQDGSIWFGSIKGAFKYNPKADKLNLVYPNTYISNIRLYYENVDWSEYTDQVSNWYSIPENLELPYRQNHLIFEFSSSSLKNPDKVRYQYMLEPFDKGWSPVVDKTEAVYSNIPPGEYIFKVKSCNNDGIWNEDPETFVFTIITPFWQTWWFILSSVLFILIVLRIVYKHRVRTKINRTLALEQAKLEEAEKVRKRVARDFQDELGNHLASISMFVQVLKAKLGNNKSSDINNLLHKLDDYSSELYSNAKDFVWSLDPQSDNLKEVMLYIKDLGEEVFDNSHIEFIMNENLNESQHRSFPSGVSRQIVLMIKEAFFAIKKFQNVSSLELKLSTTHDFYEIMIIQKGAVLSHKRIQSNEDYKLFLKRAQRINNEVILLNHSKYETEMILKGRFVEDAKKKRMKTNIYN